MTTAVDCHNRGRLHHHGDKQFSSEGSTMGAWGYGPFDSDSALDYLGDVARRVARYTDDGVVDPASVDRTAAAQHVRDALEAILRPAAPEEYRADTCASAYAAAGLVAAVLTGHTADAVAGTRLLATIGGIVDPDRLGLDTHCGYVALVDHATATDLREPALSAVKALRTQHEWLSDWKDPDELVAQFDRLEQALSVAAQN